MVKFATAYLYSSRICSPSPINRWDAPILLCSVGTRYLSTLNFKLKVLETLNSSFYLVLNLKTLKYFVIQYLWYLFAVWLLLLARGGVDMWGSLLQPKLDKKEDKWLKNSFIIRLKKLCVSSPGGRGSLYCTVLYCTVLYCTVLYCISSPGGRGSPGPCWGRSPAARAAAARSYI